jgi:uncharacterized protein (TIGR02145 family)
MMKYSIIRYLSAALLVASLFSCKKNEEPTLPTLGGEVKLSLPVFYTADDFLEIELGSEYLSSTAKRNEDGGIGYYFYNSVTGKRDTARFESQPLTDPVDYLLTFKDTLGTFSLTCGAYAKNYYAVTDVATLILVDEMPGATLTGFDVHTTDIPIMDERDGRIYFTTQIGNLWWMRQNLAWEGAGRAYLSSRKEYMNYGTSAISTILGRYYNWEEAKTACPEGWTLPTAQDWVSMIATVTGTVPADPLDDIGDAAGCLMGKNLRFNKVKMWDYWRGVDITDASNLSLLPTGYALNTVPGIYSFHEFGTSAFVWTADEWNGMGIYRFINEKFPVLYIGRADPKSFCASIRCVKSAE